MEIDTQDGVSHPNFDPAYFRETRPGWQGVDDAACLAAWIDDPSLAGAGCGRDRLVSLGLDLDDYPAVFPWELYVRLRPDAGADRWAALEHFCRRGFNEGVQLPFDPEAKDFLVSLARSYAGRDDCLAIRAFERAAVLAPLSPDAQQHLGDSYLRLRLVYRARQVYLDLLRSGEGSDWTLRNCIKCNIALCDWEAAAEVLFETKATLYDTDPWNLAAFELIEDRFAWDLQRAQSRYAAGKMAAGDEDVAAAVAAAADLLERLGLVVEVKRGAEHILVIANCDDGVSYSQRAEAKSALFAHFSTPWRLVPMTEIENMFHALSGASALVFFNAPATLLPLRVVLAARRAQIPVIYEADSPLFDPDIYPPPIASFDGLITPAMHHEMRVKSALARELAKLCDFGLAVTDLVASKLERLVLKRKSGVLVKFCNSDPFIFPSSQPLPARFLFVRAPRFLALVDEPGTLGAALLQALRAHDDLGLVTSGYVHLESGFNAFDAKIVELGSSAEPSTYRSVIAASALAIAPRCMEDDDGMTELIWLEAAELGTPTLLDGRVAAALGLISGETCVTVEGPGWGFALEQALPEPEALEQIGQRAREHARSYRSIEVAAAQLMAALHDAVNEEVAQ